MLGVTVVDVALLAYTFRKGIFAPVSATAKDTASKELKTALSKRATWVFAFFFFFYVGAEVTSGGNLTVLFLQYYTHFNVSTLLDNRR